jgi:transposase
MDVGSGLVEHVRVSRGREISDEAWARIEPLLPDRAPRRGGRWRDHRVVVEAICWRTRTGAPWRDLPTEFGPWQTAWHRFNAWAGDGTWDKVLIAIQGAQHAAGQLVWTVSVDSTIARAHQHAAGARKDTTGGFVELQESGARTR